MAPGMQRVERTGIESGGIMSFGLYILGYVILIAGLGLGAYYMHIPAHWVTVGVLVLIGIGVASGVAKTRQKDPS